MPKALSSETMIAARKVPEHAAETADHDDDQSLGDHLHVHRVVGGLARQFKRAAEAREKDAEREDAGEEPFLVDAERRHHLAILSRGAHQHAPGRAVEDEPDERENERSERDQQQVVSREGVAEEVDRALEAGRARAEQLARAPDQQHEILDDERDAEGREQLKQNRRVVDAAQQQHFDQRADHGDAERGEHDRGPEANGAAEPVGQRVTDIGAEHVEGAMGEIDDAGYAENDREAGSDEKQRAGAREPGDELDEVEAQGRAPPLLESRQRTPQPLVLGRRAISSAAAAP